MNTTIRGNLTRDPEIRYTRDGEAITTLAIGTPDGPVEIFARRELAENCALSLTMGSAVIVSGELEKVVWTAEDGRTRTDRELTAVDVGASMLRATVDVHKVQRHQGAHWDTATV